MGYQIVTLYDPSLPGQKRRHILYEGVPGAQTSQCRQGLFDAYRSVTYSREGPLRIRLEGFCFTAEIYDTNTVANCILTVGKGINDGGFTFTDIYDMLYWRLDGTTSPAPFLLPLSLPKEVTINPQEAIVVQMDNVLSHQGSGGTTWIQWGLNWISWTLH